MSVPAGDITTDPLGKLLQPTTNEELPPMVIDTDGVVHNASILSTKENCQDTANRVATTAACTLQSKESITTVSQPVTLFGPEEISSDAIQRNSLPEVSIASHFAEAVEERVQIFAPEAQHELHNAADQQPSHPLDPEITRIAVSTEILDDIKSDTGLPHPVEGTSKVSITEAFTIAEVKDINTNQGSSVFASDKNNGNIELPSAEETDRDAAVDSPPIPAETGIELHEEPLNSGSDGLGISSELVDAPHAEVQDIPLESVSQAVREEQFFRESGSGPEETPLPSEGDILDHVLVVETLPAETLLDVAKPATTQAFEEAGIVDEILAPEIPEELVRVSQDPTAILAFSNHKAEDSSSAEAVLPDTAIAVAEAAGHVLVDHSAVGVDHTVTVVEEVAPDNLKTLGVEGLSDTKQVSLDGGDCIEEGQVASASEFLEPSADASIAPVTAMLTDEQTVQITEHGKDVTEPTLAERDEVFDGEIVDSTITQSLSNESATDARAFTASDSSDVQAKTSATAPSEAVLAEEAKEHAQDPQDDSEATTLTEEGTVKLEAGVPTKEEQLEIHSTDSFSSTEIDNSSTHSQPSADQVADVTSTHSTEDQISFEIKPSEEVATNIVTLGVVPLDKARVDTEERIQETVAEVSISQMESIIEGKVLLEEQVADDNVPQESVPNVNVPQQESVTKASLLQEESVVEGNAPREEPVTEANIPQEELAIEVIPQEEPINVPQEESLIEVNSSQVTSKNEPTSKESPAFNIGIISVEQQNPAFLNGVAPVPLLEQITPVVPTHSPDLAKPNHQASVTQVPAANTVSARDEVTYVPSEVPVVENSILQHQGSVVEGQVLDDLTAPQASRAQITADAIVKPPPTENVESSTLSIGIDTEPSADGITKLEELPSAASNPHLLNTDVTSIEHPNSPFIPSFMVTTIGYSSPSDEPSAPDSPVDVDEQGTIAHEETAPIIQIESSVTVQTDNEAPLDNSQLPARPWTPSYSVHSQGTPLVLAKELDDEESDVLNDAPSAELWTPSYSVHSQGTPLVTAKELDNEDADDLVDNSGSTDANEPKREETKFAKRTEQPEVSPDSQPDEPKIQDRGPPPQHDPKEETRELLDAVNQPEKELNMVTNEEALTSEIISNKQNRLRIGMGTSRDIPTVVTEESSTEEAKQPMDQLEGQSHSPSWVPSYTVSNQGSPLPETRELQAIVEAGSPTLSMHEPITPQDSFEASQSIPEHVHTPVIPVSVPPTSTELSTDEDYVQNVRLGSEQCLDEPTIHNQLSDISIPVLVPSTDPKDSQKDTWPPSYSVTTQGAAQSHIEIFDVSSGSSSAAIEPLGEAAHDSNEPSPSLTSDILDNAPSIVNEQSNSDAFQSDIFDQLAIGQPTLLERHPSELVSEPRLASTGDKTPTQTAVVLDKHAVVDVETPADELSHHIFSSPDNTPGEGAPDSKDKPVVPRLVPLEKYSNDTLHPQPSERKRLESTTSSRFFPGGWFSSSSTKSLDESRPSLELAQGEFIPTKSPTDGTEAIVSGVSSATTESFGDAREVDSASSEEKRKWCIIM